MPQGQNNGDGPKFTPPPWSIGRSEIEGHVGISREGLAREGGWSQFASVVTRMEGALLDDPVGVANARLIAAAPELYEALAGCVERLRRCATIAGNADFAVDALCEQFEAALRKARGEQS